MIRGEGGVWFLECYKVVFEIILRFRCDFLLYHCISFELITGDLELRAEYCYYTYLAKLLDNRLLPIITYW